MNLKILPLFLFCLLYTACTGQDEADDTLTTVEGIETTTETFSETPVEIAEETTIEAVTETAEDDEEIETEPSSSTEENEDKEEADTVRVKTFLGEIKGKRRTLDSGLETAQFLGIPYAQPPVGDLRFKPPQPVAGFLQLDALDFGDDCPQVGGLGDVSGSEDCLYLNIYTPAMSLNKSDDQASKPVMVWIHGGGFYQGSGKIYDPAPLLEEDVVVVTINYRLGGFGFLTFGNDVVSGNMGLRDQLEALKWVKRFISSFGGDAARITIFGESAGGISVNALQMSPKSQGLISGAIAQSGTMLLFKHRPENSREERIAVKLAEMYNCSSTRLDARMLDCMQQVDVHQFILDTKVSILVEEKENDSYERGAFFPVQDSYSSDPVLPLDALTALKHGYFNQVPMMTGTVKNDGIILLPKKNFARQWNLTAPTMVGIASSTNSSEATEKEFRTANNILQYYNGKNFNMEETVEDLLNMMNDAFFTSPDQKLCELASKYVPVYNYRFTYQGSLTFLPFLMSYRQKDLGDDFIESLVKYTPVHADDVLYLFNVLGMSAAGDNVSRMMVKYWTNFAKYGHPSPLMRDNLTLWTTYSDQKRYMELNTMPRMRKGLELERMEFWENMLWKQREMMVESSDSLMNKAFHMLMYILNNIRSSVY